ncbi:MAG: hypothetical protein IJ071_11040 [Ruminococcus sp.]|nr:hypothetical protein [Ruminococcus sp.]
MKTEVIVKVRDRIGVVNEVSGTISRLGIAILRHGARVSTDRSGTAVSTFHAELDTDSSAQLLTLRRKCQRIKGFISFTEQ